MGRRYNNNMRKHRRRLSELVKTDEDFDYGFLHRIVVQKLRNMYEYYLDGDNVHIADTAIEKRLDTLRHALSIAGRIEKIEEEGFPDKSLYKEFYTYIGENITLWWD